MNITAKTQLCMVIGDPINHSLSPLIHNAAYKATGIEDKFVYIASNVKIEDLEDFTKGVRSIKIHGISLTIPHKVEIIKYLDVIDNDAKKIGAVNTIVNKDGKLMGYNTDWYGIINPLEKITKLNDKKVALIGAGGAARAAAYGIIQKGANLTIYNRNVEAAKKLAKEFGCEFKSLDQLREISDADIIINATPVGLHPNVNDTPLPKEYIQKNQIIFDTIYTPYDTLLLKEAESKGAKVIHGLEMFLEQGAAQFKLFTDLDAPYEVIKKILLEELGQKNRVQNINYCLPVIKTNKKAALEVIKENINQYSYFEVWTDYVKDIDKNFIDDLDRLLGEKLIIVLRRKNLEQVSMDSTNRLEIINSLNNSIGLLDLDIYNQAEEIKYIKNNKLNINRIISYHNYKKTPSESELLNIVKDIQVTNPTIIKISTTCNDNRDALRLLKLLETLKERRAKAIVLGMGKFGIITRIYGTLYGNEMIFAPISKNDESADSQLTKMQLENIFKEIGG